MRLLRVIMSETCTYGSDGGLEKHHLILIGFMGTGKSTVGRMLAERLGWPWVDTDTEVERQAGRSIPELFAEGGEVRFREWEKRILWKVTEGETKVITTGGGIVLDPANTNRIATSGWTVALDATEEELIRRLVSDQSRPLLEGNARRRVRELKRERQGVYDFADFYLDTTGLTPAASVERIIKSWKGCSDGGGV